MLRGPRRRVTARNHEELGYGIGTDAATYVLTLHAYARERFRPVDDAGIRRSPTLVPLPWERECLC